jgi:hypothetical protein
LVIFALVALIVYGGVTTGWRYAKQALPQSLEKGFMEGCTGRGGTEPKCHCLWDWMDTHVQPDEIKRYGDIAATPGYHGGQEPSWVYDAAAACTTVA